MLDINNSALAFWIEVWKWAIGGAIYVLTVMLVYWFLDYVLGYRWANWVLRIFLFPWLLTAWCWLVLNRTRQRWLLEETFGIHDLGTPNNAWLVETDLCLLALSFYDACSEQERARQVFPPDKDRIRDCDKYVKLTKNEFWYAHALAKRNGFYVAPSYKDYLRG